MSKRVFWNAFLEANSLRAEMTTKINSLFPSMKTFHLVLVPVVAALVPILVLVCLHFVGHRDTPAQAILSGTVFFLWGCTGLPILLRQEIPWLPTAPRWLSIIQGIIFLVIGWGIALGFAILLLKSRM